MTTGHYVPGEREQQSNYTKFVCVPPPRQWVKGSQVQRLCLENVPQKASCDSTLGSI